MFELVTVMFAPPKFVPVTVTVRLVDAVPRCVVKPESAFVLRLIAGAAGSKTVPVTITFVETASLDRVTVLLFRPKGAAPVRRT